MGFRSLTTDHRPLATAAFATIALAASVVRADDAEFLDGLRQRQLFGLAEVHCRKALARTDLSPRERADLTVELSQTLVEHALNRSPEAREDLWTKAEEATGTFLAANAVHPRRLVVQLADALVPLARGESLRQEAETLGAGVAPVAAVEALRAAAVKLAALARDVVAALRERHKNSSLSDDELTAAQLQSLGRHVEFQSARAQVNAGLSFAVGTTDRADGLTQAMKRLDSLAASSSADEIVWQARLDRVRCRRLLGHAHAAAQEAAQLAQQPLPAALRLPLATEQARLALAQGETDAALSVLDGVLVGAGATGASPAALADADLAKLEALLAAWRHAYDGKQQTAAESRQREASALVRQMAARHSPYWARRAKLLLANTLSRVPGVADVTVLVASAEQFWHAGRWTESLAAYDRAIEQARRSQSSHEAFQLELTAASIEEARGTPARAIERYRQAALSAADVSEAPRAHLHAAWLAAKQTGAKSDEYGELLREHIARWPKASSTDDARLWMGRWHESKGEWLFAAHSYRGVGSRHAQFAAATRACGDCYERHLRALSANKQPAEDLAAEAAGYFESLLPASADSQQTWSAAQRAALLAAASIRVRYARDGGGAVIGHLRRFLAAKASGDSGDASAARGLLVAALAGGGEIKAAAEEFKKLSGGEGRVLSRLQDDLARLSERSNEPDRQPIAALQVEVVRRARLNNADPKATPIGDKNLRLKIAEADALAAAGRRNEALAAYKSLAAQRADDAAIQRAYGRLLLAADDQLAAALAQWRLVEQKTRPGTPGWFEAKYSIALAHERSGEKQQAARVVTLLAALYPELGGQEQAAKFRAILARCQK
jgi:hypothetical protein